MGSAAPVTCIALACALVPAFAVAEPIGEDDAPRPVVSERTASDAEGAPVPGDESGRLDTDAGDSALRQVGRGALFLPKLAVEVAFAPVRAGVWAYERYHLKERMFAIFFNDAGTIGLFPVAALESQYGVTVGARFVHRDLFGARERLGLHAGAGGRFRQIMSAKLRSGDRFGRRFALELDGEFERRPKDAFYGIGNANAGALVEQADSAVEGRFRQQLVRAAAIADVRVAGNLHLRGAGAVADFELGRSDVGPPIDELYPMETMVGFDGFRHVYSELELRWDTRRNASHWEAPSVRATGWLLAGFAGRVTALDDGADYWRFGTDLQRFVKIGQGPRVISGRIYTEAVSGTLDEVPFTQLPRLGGKTLLRGYALDRFRDRVAAVGSIEYAWDLSRIISASTFVDAGRVFPSVRDVRAEGLRVGYGIALEGHTNSTFLIRASIASSIDGGVFVDLAFDPVFDLEPRVERR
jgi:hypothetical protein